MIQQSRKNTSTSFLRELEFALILIKDIRIKEHFLKKAKEVFDKRQNKGQKSGEKDLKSELLAYLRDLGKTQTANVWARNLEVEEGAINKLLGVLQERLLEKNCQGILEIHLQDREINSPHIQYVGINALMAETIIAIALVEFGYEMSFGSAVGRKDFKPYYLINSEAKEPKSLDETMSKKKPTIDTDKLLNDFESLINSFKQKLQKTKKQFIKRLTSTFDLVDTTIKLRIKKQQLRLKLRKRRLFRRR